MCSTKQGSRFVFCKRTSSDMSYVPYPDHILRLCLLSSSCYLAYLLTLFITRTGKRNVPVHDMKASVWSGVMVPLVINLSTRCRWAVRFTRWPSYP